MSGNLAKAMSKKIDPELLEKYVSTLLRFGRAEAPYWFVGLEEGGGNSEEEVAGRLQRWARSGYPEIDYFSENGVPNKDHSSKYLPEEPGQRAHLQRTWSNQLRIVLGIEGTKLNNEIIRKMQVSEHGTKYGNTSLLELYPLPCNTSGAWNYKNFGLGSAYSSKAVYRKRLLSPRLNQIMASAARYKPAAIVFTTWQQRSAIVEHVPGLMDLDIGTGKTKGEAKIGMLDGTAIVVCSHPANYFSNKSEFFWNLGRSIRQSADESRLPEHLINS